VTHDTRVTRDARVSCGAEAGSPPVRLEMTTTQPATRPFPASPAQRTRTSPGHPPPATRHPPPATRHPPRLAEHTLDGQVELQCSWRQPEPAIDALLNRRIGGKAVLHVD
jgi:hypothetical protein